jgi:hypothetical protein
LHEVSYPLKCLGLSVDLVRKAMLLSGRAVVSDDGVKPSAFFGPKSLDFPAYEIVNYYRCCPGCGIMFGALLEFRTQG